MSNKLRVLFATRRFWPHGGFDSAAALLSLASGMQRLGIDVEVLAPRYASTWPENFKLRELTIHRPAAAPRSDWSMGRYIRHLTHWLREHARSYDLIYVDSAREETIAIAEATRGTSVAKLVRVSGWGAHSDASWWDSSRSGARSFNAVKRFDACLAKNASDHRTLLARGIPANQVFRVDSGFTPGTTRSPLARSVARKVLAEVNGDLSADIHAPVMLCMGRMIRGNGMDLVVDCVRTMVARYSNLRVWFVGDGPNRDSLYSRLRSDGVRASVAMPGSFLDTEDLVTAADVYLQTDDEGIDHFLPAAVSAELPIVAVRTPSIEGFLGAVAELETGVSWYTAGQGKSLCQAVRKVIDDLPQSRAGAAALRKLLVRSRPQRTMIDQHVAIVRQLVEARVDPQSRTNIEVAS